MNLRWYQTEAVDAAWASTRSGKHPCIVLPTGAGKSLVIAELCRQAVENWKGRVIVLAHRKELLVQNADKIQRLLPTHDIGIYSAGLRQKDTRQSIVCAGIQSCFRRACDFGIRHLLIVDESHLIPKSDDGIYRKFIADASLIFPRVKIIGLTATPFRMDCGLITDGGVLDEICYEASVSRLMADGYLSKVSNKPTSQVNMEGVRTARGEFVQQQAEERFLAEMNSNVDETIHLTLDRKSVLWFTSGVAHAHRVAELIEKKTDEVVGCITGETLPLERAGLIEAFASRKLRHLVNCDVLTTGFDAPCIDAISVLRATQSAGLFAQICGRGFRLHDDKKDCLVLDFGGNIERHGPLDALDYGRRRKRTQSGEASLTTPQKACLACSRECSIGCVWCPFCGNEFPIASQLHDKADTNSALLSVDEQPEWFSVDSAIASLHRPNDARKRDTLRLEYRCEGANLIFIKEWICVEHEGFAFRKARQWWAEHSVAPMPETVSDAVHLFNCGALRVPRRICCKKENGFWRVLEREFDDERPETWESEPVVSALFENDEEPF